MSLLKHILSRKVIVSLYAIAAIVSSLSSYYGAEKIYRPGGPSYKKHNNYIIFDNSFEHLVEGKDLYVLYPEEQWDLFKYSPTFAVFFGVFSLFPDVLGLTLWNLANALLLVFAVYKLPRFNQKTAGLLLLIVLIEMITSMQNQQSNGLMVGLLVMAFACMERKQMLAAMGLIVFAVFVKPFALVGFSLCIFYPNKLRQVGFALAWGVVLLALPLLVISLSQYQTQVLSFMAMLSVDHSTSLGFSVMGWLDTWFGVVPDKLLILGLGVIFYLMSLLRPALFRVEHFRYLAMASTLIWVVIFNHKAESPTFVIAMAGVALWYILKPRGRWDSTLLVMALIFTSLSVTDIFPLYWRQQYVMKLAIKAVPCILIWGRVVFEMMSMRADSTHRALSSD